MKFFLTALMLLTLITVQGPSGQARLLPIANSRVEVANRLAGRWQVKFAFSGGSEKKLIFNCHSNGSGSFLLLDTGVDGRPEASPRPAACSLLTNDRVSFSGEVELPIGTCCRELGTLMFKGKFISSSSISGKLIFVTSVDEEESPYQFRSLVGTFSANRLTAQMTRKSRGRER